MCAVPVLSLLAKLAQLTMLRTWASDESLGIAEWGYERHVQLSAETHIWSVEYVILLVFFSPTVYWALLIYTPTFIATSLVQLHFRSGLSQTTALVPGIGGICLTVCFGLLLFYAVQMRELKNYFET